MNLFLRHVSYWWNWFFSQFLHYIIVDVNKQYNTNAHALTSPDYLLKLRLSSPTPTTPSESPPTRLNTLYRLNYSYCTDSNNISSNKHNDNNNVNKNDGEEIKIITWNIHGGFNGTYKHTFMDQCEYLATHDADIICLQEVDNTWHTVPNNSFKNNDEPNITTCNMINQTVFLAQYCGYAYYVQYNNMAIISRFPIIHTHHIMDNMWSMGYGSHAIVADILLDTADDEEYSRTISVYNCHLNNDLVGYEQWHFVQNTKLIQELLTLSYNRLPLVICGDFNSISWYSGLKRIREVLCYPPKHEIWTRNRPTFPVSFPMLKLDRIYTNQNTVKNSNIEFVSNYVDYMCKFSDHYPLVSFFAVY